MHVFNSTYRKARTKHTCTCCSQTIHEKEIYIYWVNVDDHFFTNKMHPECYQCLFDRYYGEYNAYDNDRPPWRLTNHGLVLLFEKLGFPTFAAENYERPVLPLGQYL